MYPSDLDGVEDLAELPEEICSGGSVIISPLGEVIAGPLYGEEGILYADLDLADVVRSRFDFDAVGHYSRPDVFQLHVDERPKPEVNYDRCETLKESDEPKKAGE
jgi:nitrilase